MSVGFDRIARKVLDGIQYAAVVVGLTVAVVGAASFLLVGDLVPLKWFLFLTGLLSAGLGTLKLRPKAAWKDTEHQVVTNSHAEEGYGAFVRRLPPVARLDYEREDYLSDGGRLMVLGLLALASSFALEAVFGVGVPQVGGAA